MTDQEKINFLVQAIKELKGVDVTMVTTETNLGDLHLDSLDAIELQMYYEDVNGVETKDPTGAVKTVGDLISLMP
jgi:acyl carrier protein